MSEENSSNETVETTETSHPHRESGKGELLAGKFVSLAKDCDVNATKLCQAAAEAGGEAVSEKIVYKKSKNHMHVGFVVLIVCLFLGAMGGASFMASSFFEKLETEKSNLEKQNRLLKHTLTNHEEKIKVATESKALEIYYGDLNDYRVFVQNLMPIEFKDRAGETKSIKFGDDCKFDSGAFVKKIATYKKETLVDYICKPSNGCAVYSSYCPDGVVAFVDTNKYEKAFSRNLANIKSKMEQEKKKAFVRKFLEARKKKTVRDCKPNGCKDVPIGGGGRRFRSNWE